ncbi:riboflavin synthase, alpha subunit [Rubidibacter lacunae KORDI 51-2]|uniref:Riboflavin synthase n=1 Tax=Rubidibacter lacunae KORDI 51-2 TaxID=582515 RepID=U5DNJ2_9CHRO|nr:riboflavin synthase [Rubidibacter lacunae]ERN42442.1 riboflavin synthase, alpha subunit [Rubidibacter lacunae KORDI 51-2]
MFTGLIRAQGQLRPQGLGRYAVLLSSAESDILQDLELGDSVAVDGVCLTVEELLPDGFVATASSETLARTNLGHRDRAAASVNLEPSLRAGGKLGGHFVTGHVDALGQLVESLQRNRAWEMTFAALPDRQELWHSRLARYILPKGSIAVNGISLTVADCAPDGSWFSSAVIPVTYADTNLAGLAIGSWVNLEADILGKYVERLLHGRVPDAAADADGVELAFLSEHGYV